MVTSCAFGCRVVAFGLESTPLGSSMAGTTQSDPSDVYTSSARDRLDSWKEIAAYLNRSVRTVHRWESEQNLPVHRHLHQNSGTVYAFRSELDSWWASRGTELESIAGAQEKLPPGAWVPPRLAGLSLWRLVGALVVILLLAVLASFGHLRDRLLDWLNPHAIRSVAVLPFQNLTGDPAQDHLVDAITDTLRTELARAHVLGVISGTSAAQYKEQRQSLRKIAKELNADAVVEGTVSYNGEHLEMNVQLIRASSDRHLWAQRYDRDLHGLAVLPNEIAWDILRAVPADTRAGESRLAHDARPANADAYEAYIKGRFFWSKRDPESLVKALKYFDQAIAADPSYAPAYSGLSDTYRMCTNVLSSPRDSMPKAEAAARKALELDDKLAEAHASLAGVLYRYHFDWKGAEEEFKRALELDPEYEEAHRAYGLFLLVQGRYEEAFIHHQRAAQLSPLSPVINSDFARALLHLRRFDGAIEQIRKVQEIDPTFRDAQLLLAETYRRKGDSGRALAAFEQLTVQSRNAPIPWLAYGYAVMGRKREAEAVLAALENESKKRYISPQSFAIVHMGLGNKEQALDYLEKAYEERSFISPGLADERWDVLRSEPRFQDILRRMGFAR
jgi:TolB-like protein/Tfp pilus assembly protein PilF